LGGGKHAGKGTPDIQEFLALPTKCSTFREAFEANINVHRKVGELLKKKVPTFTGGKGDEGAWAPQLGDEKALEVVVEAAERVSEEMGVNVRVGLDVAASSFWDPKKRRYLYVAEGRTLGDGDQVDYILKLVKKYRLVYVEDPVHEDDFEGFAELTKKVKGCIICGDDLFVTNKKKLECGIRVKAANAIIIKPNQVGTITDAYETLELAKRSGVTPVLSHRSGETCDCHLAHLAVGFGCPIIKTGVLGGERAAKLNELIRIELALGERASIATLRLV
jgi:enolase